METWTWWSPTTTDRRRLLLNQASSSRRWLGVRLEGEKTPYAGIEQAGVVVLRDGLPPLRRRSRTDGGYLSAHDGRVLFGLGRGCRSEGGGRRMAGRQMRGLARRNVRPLRHVAP